MAMIPYMAAGYAADRLMGGNGMTGLAIGSGVGGFSTGAFGGAVAPEVASSTGFNLFSDAVATPTSLYETALNAPLGEFGLSAPLDTTLGTLSTQMPSTGIQLSPEFGFTTIGDIDYGLGNIASNATSGLDLSQFALPTSTPVYTNALNAPLGEFGLSSPLQTQAFAEKGLMDYITPTTDFINESWEDMSLVDKGSTLMMGSQAVDTMTAPQNMIQPPQQREVIGKEPNIAAPLAINVPASGVNIRTTGQLERMLTPEQRRALGLL